MIDPSEKQVSSAAEDLASDFENSTIFSDPALLDSANTKKKTHTARRVVAVVAVIMAAVMVFTVWKVWVEPIMVDGGQSSSSNIAATVVPMVSLEYENVKTMEISAGDKRVVLQQVAALSESDKVDTVDKWIVKGVDPEITSSNIVSYRVEDACKLTAVRTLEPGKDYGMGTPTKVIHIVMKDDSEHTITVGKETPDKSGFYCSVNWDKDNIYLVETSSLSLIEADPLHYADKTVIRPLQATEVGESYFKGENSTLNMFSSITITGSNIDGKISLGMTSDSTKFNIYSLTSPMKAFADDAKVLELLAPIADGFSVNSAVSYDFKADKAKFGLDKPAYVAEYKIGTYSEKIWVSKGDADSICYVAFGENPKAIYKSYTNALPFEGLTVTGLYTPYPFFENITTVEQISVSGPKGDYTFDLTHIEGEDDNTKNLKVASGKTEIDVQSFRYFYQHLVKLSAISFTDKPEADGTDITIRVKFLGEGAKDTVISYTKISDMRYYLAVNGAPYGIAASGGIEALFDDCATLVSGGKINS